MRLTLKETLEGHFVRSLFALPAPLRRPLVGATISRQGRRLDEQAQLALRLSELVGKKSSFELSVDEARRELEVTSAQVAGPTTPMETVRERKLGGRPVRIYQPKRVPGARPHKAILYFHGGGFVVGSLDSHDAPCRHLADRTARTVISVDYRLAPEHAFPAAINDAVAVFRDLVEVAKEPDIDIDPHHIAIAGDSAGGNIAAVLALETARDVVRPQLQLLIYPAIDMTMSFPSINELGHGFFLERESITWYRAHYLQGADPRHPKASPIYRADVELAAAAPAIVLTAGFDPLRDEGQAYADKLRSAGVRVVHRELGGLFHGFWNTVGIMDSARRALDEVVGAFSALEELTTD